MKFHVLRTSREIAMRNRIYIHEVHAYPFSKETHHVFAASHLSSHSSQDLPQTVPFNCNGGISSFNVNWRGSVLIFTVYTYTLILNYSDSDCCLEIWMMSGGLVRSARSASICIWIFLVPWMDETCQKALEGSLRICSRQLEKSTISIYEGFAKFLITKFR